MYCSICGKKIKDSKTICEECQRKRKEYLENSSNFIELPKDYLDKKKEAELKQDLFNNPEKEIVDKTLIENDISNEEKNSENDVQLTGPEILISFLLIISAPYSVPILLILFLNPISLIILCVIDKKWHNDKNLGKHGPINHKKISLISNVFSIMMWIDYIYYMFIHERYDGDISGIEFFISFPFQLYILFMAISSYRKIDKSKLTNTNYNLNLLNIINLVISIIMIIIFLINVL